MTDITFVLNCEDFDQLSPTPHTHSPSGYPAHTLCSLVQTDNRRALLDLHATEKLPLIVGVFRFICVPSGSLTKPSGKGLCALQNQGLAK
jgi:hypothetical protein